MVCSQPDEIQGASGDTNVDVLNRLYPLGTEAKVKHIENNFPKLLHGREIEKRKTDCRSELSIALNLSGHSLGLDSQTKQCSIGYI